MYYRAIFLTAVLILFRVIPSAAGSPLSLDPGTRLNGASIRPGLLPYYVYDFYRNIDQMDSVDQVVTSHSPGAPVAEINHKGGTDDPVFASGKSRGVGIVFTGGVHLAHPGLYSFQVLSNDGVELRIGRQPLLADPDVHKDHLSTKVSLTVDEPGWYPLAIRYFQRKGTSALVLYWQPPGAPGMTPVPAAALGHPLPSGTGAAL